MEQVQMSDKIDARGYAHPEVLVSTDWVAEHLKDPASASSNPTRTRCSIRRATSPARCTWTGRRTSTTSSAATTSRATASSALMSRIGATQDTTVVFYGDKNNWWACYAFWVFQLFGHTNAKVMDGGRVKWEKENRALTRDVPTYTDDRLQGAGARRRAASRLPRRGARAPEDAAASSSTCAARRNTPARACTCPTTRTRGRCAAATFPARRASRGRSAINPDDGTFKTADELRKLYCEDNRLSPVKATIAYCRIGERSSHTWFALKYLLGFENVRNYDGSWTEWGNMVSVPIEK